MEQRPPIRKRPRLARDQARDALIEAGKRLLLERGLDTGLGLVTLNDAVIESHVPRSSAYRLYAVDDADPQVAFRLELLTALLEDDPLDDRRHEARHIAEDILQRLETRDPAQLAYALREIIRVAYNDNFLALLDDPNWKIIGPSLAATALTDWAPQEHIDAHRNAIHQGVAAFIPLYQTVATACGFKLREPFTWYQFALMASAATAIATFYATYEPDLNTIMRPTGPNHEMQEWSHNAIIVEGLARTMFTPDPDADTPIDLSVWNQPSHENP